MFVGRGWHCFLRVGGAGGDYMQYLLATIRLISVPDLSGQLRKKKPPPLDARRWSITPCDLRGTESPFPAKGWGFFGYWLQDRVLYK